ncbi:MAG TPA: zinc ribbon domain-containing protein [Noviherbaspirillum sp.]|nr:zinc ribbon domain-containing protein [Noviherbaspirillum sp.]
MARFCTKCGTRNESHARFCEQCGNPITSTATPLPTPPVAAAATTAFAIPRLGGRRLAISGVLVVTLAAVGGGLAWWLAPETASEASFARAINAHFGNDANARDKILCTGNLPYDKDPIRVDEFNRSTRQYMDMLVQAGVYTAPKQESSGGYFPRTHYVYALSDEGKKWVRNSRLCLGAGLQAKQVSGFEQVEEIEGKPFAVASAQLEINDEAPWLAKASNRDTLLRELDRQSMSVSLPVTRVDGKWTVSNINPAEMLARRVTALGKAGSDAGTGGGFFDALKSFFSFGASHPLVGKWQDESGLISLEFTNDAYVQNGVSMKAKFETRGDQVAITPEGAAGVGLILKMRDSDTALLDMGLASVTLKRVN